MTNQETTSLSPAQLAAVEEFRLKNGRDWKSKLSALWTTDKDGPLLRQVRNQFGPEWLQSYKPAVIATRGELSVGGYDILATVDDDGHLTLSAKHSDGSELMDVGEDVAVSDYEFAVRLTTQEIENQYRAESSAALSPKG